MFSPSSHCSFLRKATASPIRALYFRPDGPGQGHDVDAGDVVLQLDLGVLAAMCFGRIGQAFDKLERLFDHRSLMGTGGAQDAVRRPVDAGRLAVLQPPWASWCAHELDGLGGDDSHDFASGPRLASPAWPRISDRRRGDNTMGNVVFMSMVLSSIHRFAFAQAFSILNGMQIDAGGNCKILAIERRDLVTPSSPTANLLPV